MSLTGSSSTWSTFLSDLPASDDSTNISDEDQFHREFKEICSQLRERDPERLLAKFQRHHDQIIAFVSALDESAGSDASKTPSSVFWSKAFETVKVCRPNKALWSPLTFKRKHCIPNRKTSSSRSTFQRSASSFQLLAPNSHCFRTVKKSRSHYRPYSRYTWIAMKRCLSYSVRSRATVSA